MAAVKKLSVKKVVAAKASKRATTSRKTVTKKATGRTKVSQRSAGANPSQSVAPSFSKRPISKNPPKRRPGKRRAVASTPDALGVNLMRVIERSFDTASLIGQLGLGTVLPTRRPGRQASVVSEVMELVHTTAQRARALASEAVGLGARLAQSNTPHKRAAPVLLKHTGAALRRAIEQDSRALDMVRGFEDATLFTVCPKTTSGLLLHDFAKSRDALPLAKLRIDRAAAERCMKKLARSGCTVLEVGDFSITASGPASIVASMLDIELSVERSHAGDPDAQVLPSELYVSAGAPLVNGRRFHADVDGFVFSSAPISLHAAPSPNPPVPGFKHLDAAGVRRFLGMPTAGEDATYRGRGVRFALIDTGFHAHPYFTWNRCLLEPRTTATSGPAYEDGDGHGTMMAWNVFAVAPECRVWGYKHTHGAPQDAIINARRAGASVICCSWGLPVSRAAELVVVRAEIQSAIAEGAIVVCAVGNRDLAWPAVLPDVVSVGGVHADPASGRLSASTFTQRGTHDGRSVPDVCGLSGHAPSGVYLPLPCPPASTRDVHYGKNPFPQGDGISMTDGWVYASGSSSAAAQIAAVVALLVEKATQRGRMLDTAEVVRLLQSASIDVSSGSVHHAGASGLPSKPIRGGLVNVAQALALIRP